MNHYISNEVASGEVYCYSCQTWYPNREEYYNIHQSKGWN